MTYCASKHVYMHFNLRNFLKNNRIGESLRRASYASF